MFTNGLQKLPKDKRQLKVGAVFGKPKEIPTHDFIVTEPLSLKDQGDSFRCSGYAAALVAEVQEGVPLSGDFLYGMAKSIEGDMSDGANLRSVCKALTKIGAIKESDWKEKFTEQEIKEWWKYKGKYEDLAVEHRKKAYFEIEQDGDFFDNIRSAMWEHRDKKCFVLTGTSWYSGWLGYVIDKIIGFFIGGHAIGLIGQEYEGAAPHLVGQNSGGKRIGKKGRQLFSREVVNKYFKPYGAFMFIDMDPEEVKKLVAELEQTKSLMRLVIEYAGKLLSLFSKKKWNFTN